MQNNVSLANIIADISCIVIFLISLFRFNLQNKIALTNKSKLRNEFGLALEVPLIRVFESKFYYLSNFITFQILYFILWWSK